MFIFAPEKYTIRRKEKKNRCCDGTYTRPRPGTVHYCMIGTRESERTLRYAIYNAGLTSNKGPGSRAWVPFPHSVVFCPVLTDLVSAELGIVATRNLSLLNGFGQGSRTSLATCCKSPSTRTPSLLSLCSSICWKQLGFSCPLAPLKAVRNQQPCLFQARTSAVDYGALLSPEKGKHEASQVDHSKFALPQRNRR